MRNDRFTATAAAAIALTLAASGAWAQAAGQTPDWTATLGAAVMQKPVYMGSDKTEVAARPIVEVGWRDTIVLEDGIDELRLRITAFRGRHHQAGVVFLYDEGRPDTSSSDTYTKKVHDVDPTIMAGAYASYFFDTWKFDVRMLQDIVNDNATNGGYIAQLGVSYGARISDKATFHVGPRFTYASQDYMDSYFGVSSADATKSGINRFVPSEGIRDATLAGRFDYKITPNWLGVIYAEYTQLMGDAADSPLSRSDVYGRVGFGLAYKF